MVAEERLKNGRKCKTSFCIVDAQSVKNTDTAGEKGFDTGKNVSGIKRHIAVDTNGLPHALTVTTANITDRNGALEAIEKSKKNLSKVKKILADGGYTGEKFAKEVENLIKKSSQPPIIILQGDHGVPRLPGWNDNSTGYTG